MICDGAFLTLIHGGIGCGSASLLIGLSFLSSFTATAIGVGGGATILAVMALVLPPSAIIPLHGLVQLGSNAGRAALLFQERAPGLIGPFLIGCAVGVALGGTVLTQLPPAVIQMTVGAFVLWSLAVTSTPVISRSAPIVGAVSSFLTMFFGATGPFVAAYLRQFGFDRHRHIATHSVLMTCQHLLKCIVFAGFGFAFGPWLPLVGVLVAVGLIGTFAGRTLLDVVNDRLFRVVLNTSLFLLGIQLIAVGAKGYFGWSWIPTFGS